MKTREQIIILAKKAYNQYFKNDYNENHEYTKVDDIKLNKEEIIHDISNMKIEEENKLRTLEVLQIKIEKEARLSYQKMFKEKNYKKTLKILKNGKVLIKSLHNIK